MVTDFGVVGFLTSQEFEFNSYARRYLPYMAPEIRQDWGNLLPHSDFYSIGAILYEILVGRAPAAQLRLPSELSRIFGIEADEIILKSMAARPLDRFATVEAFKQAVLALQSSLLSRPQENVQGLPAAAMPISGPGPGAFDPGSHMDITTLHDPDEAAFDNPDSSREMAAPGAVPAGNAFAPQAADWKLPDAAESAGPAGRNDGEGERAFSAFAGLGDRIVEESPLPTPFRPSAPARSNGRRRGFRRVARPWKSHEEEPEAKPASAPASGLPEEEDGIRCPPGCGFPLPWRAAAWWSPVRLFRADARELILTRHGYPHRRGRLDGPRGEPALSTFRAMAARDRDS